MDDVLPCPAHLLEEGVISQQEDHYTNGVEATVAAVRLHLGTAAFAAAWAEGRSLTPAQVLARRS
jgi:hypothetical protein